MIRAHVGDSVAIGDGCPLALIAGPCVLESSDLALDIASAVAGICRRLEISFIFKSSFDKANRSSIDSFRGLPIDEGLKILDRIKNEVEVPILTDIHESHQAAQVAEVVDVLQIPALLCRQTDLLIAAAKTGRPVNVKKGQFLAPWDMGNVIDKLVSVGAKDILITERGTQFGYNSLVVDFRSLPQLRELGYPVVFDATHAVQQPTGLGKVSGGQKQFVPHLARAAAAVGIDALFLEVHPDPDSAPSDGATMVPLHSLEQILREVLSIRAAAVEVQITSPTAT